MSSGNVRSLIKQGNAKLSGKDKAQMLKSMMREKRKVESAVDSRHKAPRHGNPPSSSSHCGLTSGGNASSSIPDGFFDATSVVKSTSSSVANCEYDTSDSNVTPSTTALKSSVPVGFFDDAEADMNARGLDMYKELKKKDESLNKVVDNFFLDVQETMNANPVAEEDLDEEDIEESAVQHAYLARLANILVKADSVAGYKNSQSESVKIDQNEMNQLVESNMGNDESDGVLDGITSVLSSKYSNRGSELKEDLDNESAHSDSSSVESDSEEEEEVEVDWTARSFL